MQFFYTIHNYISVAWMKQQYFKCHFFLCFLLYHTDEFKMG